MIKQHVKRNSDGAEAETDNKKAAQDEEGKALHLRLLVRSKEFLIQHSGLKECDWCLI